MNGPEQIYFGSKYFLAEVLFHYANRIFMKLYFVLDNSSSLSEMKITGTNAHCQQYCNDTNTKQLPTNHKCCLNPLHITLSV